MTGERLLTSALSWVGFLVLALAARAYPQAALVAVGVLVAGALIAWAVVTTWVQAAETDRLVDLDVDLDSARSGRVSPLDDPARAEWFALPDGRVVDAGRREP